MSVTSEEVSPEKPAIKKRLEQGLDKGLDTITRYPYGEPTLLTVINTLTLIRIFISPIFLLLYLEHEAFGMSATLLPYMLLVLLFALELTDALDGYLARKWGQVTDLGKVLDPMADSISRISIFLTFTQPPVSLPLFVVFIFIYRDSIISTLRTVCALRGMALAASSSGKLKSIIQGLSTFCITACLIPHSLGNLSTQALHQTALIISLISATLSLYAGIEYLYTNFSFVKKALLRRKRPLRFFEKE